MQIPPDLRSEPVDPNAGHVGTCPESPGFHVQPAEGSLPVTVLQRPRRHPTEFLNGLQGRDFHNRVGRQPRFRHSAGPSSHTRNTIHTYTGGTTSLYPCFYRHPVLKPG